MGLIESEKLITDIQGIASEVCMKSPYDPEWFTRLHDRQKEIIRIIEMQPKVDAVQVVHCEYCTIKKAVQHKDGIVWRCPHRTGDVKMDGYCESGVRADGC